MYVAHKTDLGPHIHACILASLLSTCIGWRTTTAELQIARRVDALQQKPSVTGDSIRSHRVPPLVTPFAPRPRIPSGLTTLSETIRPFSSQTRRSAAKA